MTHHIGENVRYVGPNPKFKGKRGRLREDQKRFAEMIEHWPVIYGVCRSAEDAVKLVEETE